MASVSLFVFFVLLHLVLLHSAEEEEKRENPFCRTYQCGKLGNISFPFTKFPHPFQFCGLIHVECDEPQPKIHLTERPYEVINISYNPQQIRVRDSVRDRDPSHSEYWDTKICNYFDNFPLPYSPLISFKCTHTPDSTSHKDEPNFEFVLEWHVSDDCSRCHGKRGLCNIHLDGKFYCDLDREGIDIEITQKCFDAHTHVHS